MPLTAHAGPARHADPTLRTTIAAHLVRPDGAGFVPHRWSREPDIVALYFGAGWCGPCHAFVPSLRETRAALRAAGAETEVVYVSLDASAGDMRRYMRTQDMPWPAIDHRRLRALPAVQALGGPAPPNLVLIDRDGRVLASAWEGRRYRGLASVLATWVQAVRGRDRRRAQNTSLRHPHHALEAREAIERLRRQRRLGGDQRLDQMRRLRGGRRVRACIPRRPRRRRTRPPD